MTRAEAYRQRAADYAKQALEADPRIGYFYAELAEAWRDLADKADTYVPDEPKSFDPAS